MTFLLICANNEDSEPVQLWTRFKECLIEDFFLKEKNLYVSEQMALGHIQTLLLQKGTRLRLGLPVPETRFVRFEDNFDEDVQES